MPPTEALQAPEDLLAKLQEPRKLRFVNGVMVESSSDKTKSSTASARGRHHIEENSLTRPGKSQNTRVAQAAGTSISRSNLLTALSLPKIVREIDGIMTAVDSQTALHPTVSDSVLSKLALPKKFYSSDDFAEVAPITISSREQSPVGLDIDEATSGRLTPLFPHSLPNLVIDDEELDRRKRGLRPNLFSNFETLPGKSTAYLNPHSYISTATSVIFEVERNRDMLIKYQVDCFDTDVEGIHPLLKDYWFLRRLGDWNIAPKAYFLSADVAMPWRITLKTNFRMKLQDRIQCSKSGGKVRMMGVEKIGKSVISLMKRYSEGKVPIDQVVELGVKMIDLLKKLHEAGVVHGDIHAGNICFARGSISDSLRLIDFGRANLVVTENDGVSSEIRVPFTWNHELLSHWNIEGFREARRDDVFKVLLVMSSLLNGNQYFSEIQKLPIVESHAYKAKGDIFSIPGRPSLIQNDEVRELLGHVIALVRSTKLDEAPDYEGIIDSLQLAVSKLVTSIQSV